MAILSLKLLLGKEMKRKMKRTLSFAIMMTIFLANMTSIDSFASEIDKTTEVMEAYQVIEAYQEDRVRSDILKIEEKLALKGISVEKSLDDAIIRLEQEMADEASLRSQCENMIRTTQELKREYINYKNNSYNLRSTASHPVLVAAVATVASYFSANNYMLAFELLIHARDNERMNSNYIPNYGWRVQSSPVFQSLRAKNNTSGSAAFESSSTPILQDLYYAIHNFDYTVTNHRVSITDRYDYAYGDYTGVAGVAINTMKMAQDYGYLIPYYVKITK